MALEIELKVRISEPETMKKRLADRGIYAGAYEKEDAYWFFSGTGGESPAPGLPPAGLRIRRERAVQDDGGASTCTRITYKTRTLREGVEMNDEREFEVSDAGVFEDLLRRLGLKPGIQKHKQGWAWRCGGDAEPVLAELLEVRGLGWFLELEILAPPGDERALTAGQARLFALLDALEIPRSRIESRPYTEMLRELADGGENRAST
jgi:adenylate cyclase class 2